MSYVINSGASGKVLPTDGVFGLNTRVRLTDVSDGTANTLLLGEVYHPSTGNAAGETPYLSAAWAGHVFANGQGGAVMETMEFARAPINAKPWSRDSYSSGHAGGANFALADGSVRFLADGTTLGVLQELSSRASGNPVAGDW
jgi:prepilin-type processing-associated H-X9-DG protein